MFASTAQFLGGYALGRRDLRLLYAAVFLSFLGASITFPLRMLYAQAHGSSPTQLGMLAAAFMVGPIVVQLPLGWLVDHWGRVPVLLIGLITHPILSILYIPLSHPTELILLRFLEGVSVAAFQPAMAAYIADVTPAEHRSEAFGALGATLNGGLLLGPLIGGVIGQRFGFDVAFVINFLIEVLALPLVIGRIHEPRVHEERHHDSSASWRLLFSFPLIGVYISFVAVQVAFGVLGALWAIWVNQLGGSYTYIGFTFSVFALPQIVFGTGAGRLIDRFGRVPFILLTGVVAGSIYASYGFLHNLALIAILGVVEGTVIVFQQPVAQGLLAEAAPPAARGRAQGLAGFSGALGGAAASFLSLPLFHQSHPLPFVGAGIIMLIGALLTAAAAVSLARRTQRLEATDNWTSTDRPAPHVSGTSG